MSKQILVSLDGLPEHGRQRMQQIAATVGATVTFLPEADAWRSAPEDAEAAFGLPPAEFVQRSTLRFLQLHSSGYDPYCTPALLARKHFHVANARGVTAQAVAEHCLSMIFAFSRRTLFHADNQRQQLWRHAASYQLLHGTTIAILGTGAIGTALGTLCKALGMSVLAVQRRPDKPAYADRIFALEDLREALQLSTHLALALPSIPNARPMIGAEELNHLRRGAYVYNVGRASVLDYDALIPALSSGQLSGVALDVFPEEPLPAANPLWQRPDVFISPHVGGRFEGEMDTLADLFADNLERYLHGSPLRNVVIGSNEAGN